MLRKKRRARLSVEVGSDSEKNEGDEVMNRDNTDSDSELRGERRPHERDVNIAQRERRDWRGGSRDRRKREDSEIIGSPLDRRRGSDSRREEKGRKPRTESEIVRGSDSDTSESGWHRPEREERKERRGGGEGHGWERNERSRTDKSERDNWERNERSWTDRPNREGHERSWGENGDRNWDRSSIEAKDFSSSERRLRPREDSLLYHLSDNHNHPLHSSPEVYMEDRDEREDGSTDNHNHREERRMLIPADVTDEEFPVILRTPQLRHRPRSMSKSEEFFLPPADADATDATDEEQRDSVNESWTERCKKEEDMAEEGSMDDGDIGDGDDGDDGEGSPAWRRKEKSNNRVKPSGRADTPAGYNSASGYECDSASESLEESRILHETVIQVQEEAAHPSRKDRELYDSSSSGSEAGVEEKNTPYHSPFHSPFLRPEPEQEEVEQEPTLIEALIDIIASSDNDVNLRRVPTVDSQDMTSDARGEFTGKGRRGELIHPKSLHSSKKLRKGRQRSHDVRPVTRDSKTLSLRRGHGPKPASSDENPQLARLSGICRCKEYDLKVAIRSLHSHVTFPLYQVRQYPDVIAMKHRQINRCIFIFSYGVVVFFNIKKDNEAMFLNVLRPFEVEPLHDVYRDDELEYCPSMNGKFEITHNVVHLQTDSLAEKLSVAFALAQCVKLMEFEGRIEKVIESNKHLAEAMSQYGGIALSGHAITQKLGELYNERSAVNLYFDLMDTPSHFWEDDTYLPLYQRLVQYLELANRLGVLNKRLDILSELLRMVSGHLHISHKSRLEWILIWLIGIHVLFGIMWELISKDFAQLPVVHALYS